MEFLLNITSVYPNSCSLIHPHIISITLLVTNMMIYKTITHYHSPLKTLNVFLTTSNSPSVIPYNPATILPIPSSTSFSPSRASKSFPSWYPFANACAFLESSANLKMKCGAQEKQKHHLKERLLTNSKLAIPSSIVYSSITIRPSYP